MRKAPSITAQNLYFAEHQRAKISETGKPVVLNGRAYHLTSGRLNTIAEVEKFHEMLSNSFITIARFGTLPPCSIKVDGQLQKLSLYEPDNYLIRIARQRWAMEKQVVLHEFAHHIVHVKCPKLHEDAHGSTFRGILHQLMSDYLSKDDADFIKDFN